MITMVHVAGLLYNLHVSRGAFKIRFRKTSNGRHAVGAPAEQAEAYNSSILDSFPTLLLIIVAIAFLLGRLNVSHRPRKAGWAWPPCISRHRPPWLSRQWPRAIRQPAIALSGELHIDCMPTDHSNASAITPDLRQYSHLWTCGSALASCLG